MHLLLLLLRGELRDMVVQRIDERNVFEWIAWFQAEQLTFVFAAIFARPKGFAAINNRNRENMLKVKWYKKTNKLARYPIPAKLTPFPVSCYCIAKSACCSYLKADPLHLCPLHVLRLHSQIHLLPSLPVVFAVPVGAAFVRQKARDLRIEMHPTERQIRATPVLPKSL